MENLNIFNLILSKIDIAVFLLVIASGYFIRAVPIFKSQTLNVLFISLLVVSIYVFFSKTKLDVVVLTYFATVGFHSLIIKLIERKFTSNKIDHKLGSNKSDLIGSRPGNR